MTAKYESWDKERLIEEITRLQSRKKYGLVWEDKPEEVVERCKNELPVLEEITDRAIEKSDSDITNLIIEGDNYHALSVLNYTHAGKIDVIYIDPPYNTESKDFRYNDKYIDKEDAFRHSKWLSFMHHRLKLANGLLKNDGVILVSINGDKNLGYGLGAFEYFVKPISHNELLSAINKLENYSRKKSAGWFLDTRAAVGRWQRPRPLLVVARP